MKSADNNLIEAARYLYVVGRAHGWWKPDIPFELFREMDPIGFDEFLDLVAEVAIRAHKRSAREERK